MTNRLSLAVAVLFLVGSTVPVPATELTFEISPHPGNGALLPLTYGDNVNSTSQVVGSATYGYLEGNGFTPNVTLDYSSTVTNTTSNGVRVWNDGEWNQVLYPRSSGESAANANYDLIFTPDPNFGVLLNSFIYDDYDGFAGGHTVNWAIYEGSVAPANLLLSSGGDIPIAANQELLINTGMTDPVFNTLILRHNHVTGGGNDLGIDNVNFDQVAAPEPASVAMWLLVALFGLVSYGRGRVLKGH